MAAILFRPQSSEWTILYTIHHDRPIAISAHGVMRGYFSINVVNTLL